MKKYFLLYSFVLIFCNRSISQEISPQAMTAITSAAQAPNPYSIGFSVVSGIFGYMDSKEKDKNLAEIISLLKGLNSKLDLVLVKLDELGLKVEMTIKDEFKLYIQNQLLVTLELYERDIKATYPAEFTKERATYILNRLDSESILNQKYGIANLYSIGSAMIAHHNLFYILRKSFPSQSASLEFNRYEQYFDAVIYQLDSLIAKENTGSLKIVRYKLYKSSVAGDIYSEFDIESNNGLYELKNYSETRQRGVPPTSTRHKLFLQLTQLDTTTQDIKTLETEHIITRFSPYPIDVQGNCVKDFDTNILKNISYNSDIPKIITERISLVNTCINQSNERKKQLNTLRISAQEFKRIASLWKIDPYKDVNHLKEFKKI